MIVLACVALALAAHPAAPADTLRLEVGSPEVDGRVFPPHRARNRVYREGSAAPVSEWTNELTLGDSAGIRVMRWTTRGVQRAADGGEVPWELLQTYDARSLAPLAYSRTAGNGALTRLAIGGGRVRGVHRPAGETTERPVDEALPRRGFFAGASDLVPMAVGLREGLVVTAPVWSPAMRVPEVRVFSVLGREAVTVEGEEVTAWKVEERAEADGRWIATWWLTESSPYMVYAEQPLPGGGIQRMTGVALP